MNVEERHEDTDDQARSVVVFVSHGLPQRVGLPLDVEKAFVRGDGNLIKNHPVCRGEEMGSVREDWPARVAEEIVLREPAERLLFNFRHLCIDPFSQALSHTYHFFLYALFPKRKPATVRPYRPYAVAGCTTGSVCPIG